MKQLIAIFFVLCSVISVHAGENTDTLLVHAETYYTQKQYDSALTLYMQVYDENLHSADLFYNIANTYFKLNDLARAILWYERALLLDPSHRDAQNNLAFANARQIDKVETLPPGMFESVFSSLYLSMSYVAWAILSLVFLAAFLVAIVVFLFTHSEKLKKISFVAGLVFFFAALVSFACANANKNALNRNFAIITEATVTIKTEPNIIAADLVTVHEGLKVEFLKPYGDWANIRLLDGKEGWVKKEFVEKIR
ncbi:MAG: tetratricopeptide repeat protein [Bacteroidales bacterium]|jgi:tetratricopeptide (TPR) repeat protein|nr:tetratricopeptide repeat protein [Bacteroidales bacterium]